VIGGSVVCPQENDSAINHSALIFHLEPQIRNPPQAGKSGSRLSTSTVSTTGSVPIDAGHVPRRRPLSPRTLPACNPPQPLSIRPQELYRAADVNDCLFAHAWPDAQDTRPRFAFFQKCKKLHAQKQELVRWPSENCDRSKSIFLYLIRCLMLTTCYARRQSRIHYWSTKTIGMEYVHPMNLSPNAGNRDLNQRPDCFRSCK